MKTNTEIADVQASPDLRNLAVNKVGIKALKHPVTVVDLDFKGNPLTMHTVAEFNMYVQLPAEQKGTHMSRFINLLNEQPTTLEMKSLPGLVDNMLGRLEAKGAYLEAKACLFLEKEAPISKIKSVLDYEVTFKARVTNGIIQTGLTMVVPVATLCPCSKKIADYGAHNQRSHVTLSGWFKAPTPVVPFISLIESQASCELYGSLKRVDEKYVTEKAYENPKFVEDLVRDIATELNRLDMFENYSISSENFESIHNHSAFAQIDYPSSD